MKNFKNLTELLDFISQVAKVDYHQGFYTMEPKFDDEGNVSYSTNPLIIKYADKLTVFYGGMVGFADMLGAYRYQDIYYRVGKTSESKAILAFAPDKELLFDECWCIELPVYVNSILNKFEKL